MSDKHYVVSTPDVRDMNDDEIEELIGEQLEQLADVIGSTPAFVWELCSNRAIAWAETIDAALDGKKNTLRNDESATLFTAWVTLTTRNLLMLLGEQRSRTDRDGAERN